MVTLSGLAIVVAAVAGIIAGLGIIWQKAVKPIIHGLRRVGDVFDQVMDYDARLTTIEKNSKQLTNNGGSHMKDAVDRIERTLAGVVLRTADMDAHTKAELLKVHNTLNHLGRQQENASESAHVERSEIASAAKVAAREAVRAAEKAASIAADTAKQPQQITVDLNGVK